MRNLLNLGLGMALLCITIRLHWLQRLPVQRDPAVEAAERELDEYLGVPRV